MEPISTADSSAQSSSFFITSLTEHENIDEVITMWQAAFAEPPNTPRYANDLKQQLLEHMQLPNFLGFLAKQSIDNKILGIIYGYSNGAGQWWYNSVSKAVGPVITKSVLNDSFCLTELGVLASARRQGIATQLVNMLLTHQAHPNVTLSTRSDNVKGLTFYHSTGWTTLVSRMSFGWGFPPYDILIRKINTGHK